MKYGMLNGLGNTEHGWIVKVKGSGKDKGTVEVIDEISNGLNNSFEIFENSIVEISKDEYDTIEEMLLNDNFQEIEEKYLNTINEILKRDEMSITK